MASLSVIVPTLNEEHHIGVLLDQLSEQSLRPLEILVVDGNSEDQTQALVKRFSNVTLIKSSRGVSSQRNAGARKAQGDWLFFLDADTHISPEFLKTTLQLLQDSGAEAGIPRYWPYNSTWYIKLFFALSNFLFWLGERRFPSGAGAGIFIQKSLFSQIGGFHDFHVGEDLHLIQRAAQKGNFKVVPVPLGVSDRRFRTYGFWQTTWLYVQLSRHFLRGDFEGAQKQEYTFGEYSQTPPSSTPEELSAQ